MRVLIDECAGGLCDRLQQEGSKVQHYEMVASARVQNE
jgi:hypothetical protein